jgi:hypothetical protein
MTEQELFGLVFIGSMCILLLIAGLAALKG